MPPNQGENSASSDSLLQRIKEKSRYGISPIDPASSIQTSIAEPVFADPVRAACLQNETAPKSFDFKTKNGPKNDPKLSRKILSLVLLCRISHRHYSKIFHREFPHKIKYFFTTRICRHGHAKTPFPRLLLILGRAMHGPTPVSGATFDELSGPLVHTHFPEKTRQERDWSIRGSLEIRMDQWLPNLSGSSGLRRCRSIECSSL